MRHIFLFLLILTSSTSALAEASTQAEIDFLKNRLREELKTTDKDYDEVSLQIVNQNQELLARYEKQKWDECERSEDRNFRRKPPCFDILNRSNHIDSLKRKREGIEKHKMALKDLNDQSWGKKSLDEEVDDFAAQYENLRRRARDNAKDVDNKRGQISELGYDLTQNTSERDRLKNDMRLLFLERDILEKNMAVLLQKRLIIGSIQLEYVKEFIAAKEPSQNQKAVMDPFAGATQRTESKPDTETTHPDLMDPFKDVKRAAPAPH